MSTPNAADLPPELQAQVDQIREEEGLNQDPKPQEPDEVSPVRLSRREQREKDKADLQEAREQAANAAQAIADLRQRNEEDRAARQRMEHALAELTGMARAVPVPQQQEPEPKGDWRDKYEKQMKRANEALTNGDLNEYHQRLAKANDARFEAIAAQNAQATRQQLAQELQHRIPQPQIQKPAWITAVENDFPEVMTHATGIGTVTAFIPIVEPDPSKRGPDALRRAFTRASEELGLSQRRSQQNETRRQLMSGGPSTGGPRAGAGGKAGPTVNVKLAKGLNHKEIARRAGMTEQEYARAYASMNPGDVEKG